MSLPSLPSTGPCIRPALIHLFGASRAFSTTQPIRSNSIPPESPSYIRLSSPPQSEEKRLPRKIRPEYIQRTAPEPTNHLEPSNEAQKWKYELAETRRNNLKSGLRALWKRRTKSDNVRHHRVTSKFEEHRRAAEAPEREDERLTRTTVLDAMLDTKVYPDPERFSRADRSRTKVLARESAKREARRDALMELYISASGFIVQENELKAEIDRIFHEDYFSMQSRANNRYGTTGNIWGIYGKPPSIANMLEATSGSSTKLMAYYETEYDRSVNRHKKIAEDLTGGKMV
ncbi:uncharacterized protein HRG_11029 [Hirsutella rhossiliensis]|uniref:Uncharacterized protein n=1 Tax=Hirsutella rhossiliensis TaxID=111463 RepID=A0A9P8SEE1_9HYPO|nr:uncharacterized protein HRG_11029 [Hirsutella rhossiliensis]KAH0957936.1 hypothetical protein HRG_11029 [Hirsutella rhossiliensis]